MSDEEIRGFTDSLIEVHTQVVRTKGLDLSHAVSTEKEEAIRGRIISVAAPCFGTVFGQPPSERYRDAFPQIAVIARLSLLNQTRLEVSVSDSQSTITSEAHPLI